MNEVLYPVDTYRMMQLIFFLRTTGGLQYFLLVCILLCIEGCYGKLIGNLTLCLPFASSIQAVYQCGHWIDILNDKSFHPRVLDIATLPHRDRRFHLIRTFKGAISKRSAEKWRNIHSTKRNTNTPIWHYFSLYLWHYINYFLVILLWLYMKEYIRK